MKVLFIGGTGNISTECVRLALARGFDVSLLTRARREALPGARQLMADINDPDAAAAAIGSRCFDAVADFVGFTPEQIERRIGLFRGRTGQYLFVSSASVYQKPPVHWLITESTPLANPFWDYARNKIACEERLRRALREEGFPVTIVRPSWTYGDTLVPLAVNASPKTFTGVARLRRGLPMIVPGDGLAFWTMTHNTDFAKGFADLLGNPSANGEAFHITSDEALTWNQLYETVAEAAGAPAPRLVHVATDFIAACLPEKGGGLLGDKVNCGVFDNSKIKRFVPGFAATTRFREGIARTLAWFDADVARRQIDEEANAKFDRLIAAYERGLETARREVQG